VKIQQLKDPPNSIKSKKHGGRQGVRGRDEALRFYSLREHRHCDFTPEHFDRMMVDGSSELLRELGYDQIPSGEALGAESVGTCLCSWVPTLRPGDIVATHFRCESSSNGAAVCSSGRAYARVCSTHCTASSAGPSGDEEVAVELLWVVPRDWLVSNPHDWSRVEYPSAKSWGCPCEGQEQMVPREWVDLRLPCPSSSSSGCAHATPSISADMAAETGASLPLTEEGYRAAVALRSTPQMADFIARVISDLVVLGHGGYIPKTAKARQGLLGFARWFSGEANVQSLAQIRLELPGKEAEHWVMFAPPPPVRALSSSELPSH